MLALRNSYFHFSCCIYKLLNVISALVHKTKYDRHRSVKQDLCSLLAICFEVCFLVAVSHTVNQIVRHLNLNVYCITGYCCCLLCFKTLSVFVFQEGCKMRQILKILLADSCISIGRAVQCFSSTLDKFVWAPSRVHKEKSRNIKLLFAGQHTHNTT